MMKTKRLLAAIMAVLALFSFTACGKKVEQTPTDKPSILVEFYLAGLGSEYMEKIRDAFNERAKAGEYDFYVRVMGDENIGISLDQALRSGSENAFLPDAVIVNSYTPRASAVLGQDHFADLKSVYESEVTVGGQTKKLKDALDPEMVEKVEYNGGYYSVPIMGGVMGFVYNKNLFEKYEIEPPKTMAEMEAILDKIETIDVNTDTTSFGDLNRNNDHYAIVYPSGAIGYWDAVTYTFAAQYLGKEGFFDFLEVNFADENNLEESVESMRGVYDNIFKNQQKFNNVDHKFALSTATTQTNALLKFSEGTSFMTPCGDWAYSELSTIDKEFAANIGMFSVPLACNDEGLVNVPATPSSKVFEGVDKTDAAAVAAAEEGYTKIERAKVSPSVIPEEDQNAEYIYFRKVSYSMAGEVDFVIPKNAKNVDKAMQFLNYFFSSEAQNLYTKYTTVLPSGIEFDLDQQIYDELPQFSKDCAELVRVSDIVFTGKYNTKARMYNLRSELSGLPGDWRLGILKSNDVSYATGLTDHILNTIKYVTPTLDAQIVAYEEAQRAQG